MQNIWQKLKDISDLIVFKHSIFALPFIFVAMIVASKELNNSIWFGSKLFMKDLGAQDVSQERDAACKYYSGRSCGSNSAFYGNSVVKLKAQIQQDIDIIEAAR